MKLSTISPVPKALEIFNGISIFIPDGESRLLLRWETENEISMRKKLDKFKEYLIEEENNGAITC